MICSPSHPSQLENTREFVYKINARFQNVSIKRPLKMCFKIKSIVHFGHYFRFLTLRGSCPFSFRSYWFVKKHRYLAKTYFLYLRTLQNGGPTDVWSTSARRKSKVRLGIPVIQSWLSRASSKLLQILLGLWLIYVYYDTKRKIRIYSIFYT